jgi:hypothetical protein
MPDNATMLNVFYKRLKDLQQDTLVARLSLQLNMNMIDRIPVPFGFFSLYLRESSYIRSALAAITNSETSPLYDFVGISQVTKPESDLEWYPRAGAMPMVTSGQRAVVVERTELPGRLMDQNFQPREQTLLLEADSARVAEHDPSAQVSALVEPHQITAKTSAQMPTLLTIAQTWHRGWRGYLDGSPAPVLRANHAFQAVAVPAGVHTVELRFEDASWRSGLCISVAALLMVGALWRRRHLLRKGLRQRAPEGLQ